jgi:hypothetical protein
MPFLSEKTLHIVDRVLWMLPFATNKLMNEAAMKANVSHDSRNGFLQKLLGQHNIVGARQQLKELWGKGIETYYGAAGPESTGRGYGARAIQMTTLASMEASLPNLLLQGQLLQGQLLQGSCQLL